ncbi:MAG: hypothetical protein WCH34_12880 [Bacteroidota bacterium]
MKHYKKLLLVFLSSISTHFIFADQLSYITKSQADSAISVLKNQSEVLLWCACCDKDPKQIVKVSKVYYEFTGNKEFYHIFLIGINQNGKQIKEELDLAYVHIYKNGKWYSLGQELGFKCNPCTKPFN